MCGGLAGLQRYGLVVREKFESAADQLRLQERAAQTRRKELAEARAAAGGAAQPANRRGKGKGRGKAHAGGAAQPTKLGSVAEYVNLRKRSRWCRHLRRACGTKHIWEMLAFTGRFDVKLLRAPVQERDPDAEAEAAPPTPRAARRKLRHVNC